MEEPNPHHNSSKRIRVLRSIVFWRGTVSEECCQPLKQGSFRITEKIRAENVKYSGIEV
jgi:hypothetical protein